MFANQIINPNKTEREMFDLFKKISSGYLAILYQHHLHINIMLINDSYLVIKIGFVLAKCLS